MKFNQKISLILLASVSVLLSACGNKKASESKQELNWSTTGELTTLDASKAVDNVSFTTLVNVGEGLYRMNKDGNAEPAIAYKEDANKDGSQYDIFLKKTKWSNGEPVTAQDFVQSYQRIINPKTKSQLAGNMTIFNNAKEIIQGKKKINTLGVKAIGKYHLRFTLQKPLSKQALNSRLTLSYFLPQNSKMIKKAGDHYGTAAKYFVGNGPFKITKWNVNDKKWVMVKNNNYWDAKNVSLKKINQHYDASTVTSYNLYQTNKIDNTALTSNQTKEAKKDRGFQTYSTYAESYINFNLKKQSALKNLQVRQALSAAINRKELVQVLHTYSLPAVGVVPENIGKNPQTGQSFAKDSYVKEGVTYNLKRAKKLWNKVKKVKHLNSLKLTLLTNDMDASQETAEYIQSSLSKLPGVVIKVRHVPPVQQQSLINAGEYDLNLITSAPFVPDIVSSISSFNSKSAQNPGWNNTKFDNLLITATTKNATKVNSQYADYVEAEKILMEDQATIPLLQIRNSMLIKPKVKGLVFMPNSGNFDFKETYIK